ncbi:MAG: ribulose-phosphate 3-epimerase [Candidatus Saliniplasma sp.]
MVKDIKISPSLLSADFSCLREDIREVRESEWLHLDVMDGHFVPNISYGPCVISAIREVSDHFFDTHLMISEPEKYISDFVESGSDVITVHAEACDDLLEVIHMIKENGCEAGVSLKPGTPLSEIEGIIPSLDLILIMTVEPGFGGQSFMHEVVPKISEARDIIAAIDKDIDLSVDGGISPKTAPEVVKAGANVLVAGSAIFKGNIKKNLQELRDSALKTID